MQERPDKDKNMAVIKIYLRSYIQQTFHGKCHGMTKRDM